MVSAVTRISKEIIAGFDAGGGLLLLTDFDGTLTPIMSHPASVRLAPETREHLGLLSQHPRIRVGIVSGRDLRDLRERVGLPGLIYAGCHGLQVEGPRLSFAHPQAEARRTTMQKIGEWLTRRTASVPGVIVEPKRLTVAIHYRQVSRGMLGRVAAQIEQVLYEHGGAFKLLRGRLVIEILPHVGWTKGECALWIRDRVALDFSGAVTMLYMGDDQTDEQAFRLLVGKALTIRVGGRGAHTAASYRLRDETEVQDLLSALAAETKVRGKP